MASTRPNSKNKTMETQDPATQTLEGKSNDDLLYIIRYVEAARDRAGEQLLKQSPSNDDLLYIIEYVEAARDRAWEQLLKQSPSNYDLLYIIRYVEAARDRARAQVLSGLPSEAIDEKVLIKEIADAVLSRPGSLRMDQWHCGTSHCLAGWACVLNKPAAQLETLTNTETAGHIALPSYAKYFYDDDATVLELLKQVAEGKA